jgi:NAD dependent epimerase/dehydratase family enzyme
LLFGEMADVLLASQRVAPAAAEAAGFRFRFPQLAAALESLLRR